MASVPTNTTITSTSTSTATTSVSAIPSPDCRPGKGVGTGASVGKTLNETVVGLTGQVCYIPITPRQFNISSCCLNNEVREFDCQSLCLASLDKGTAAGQRVALDLTRCLQKLYQGTNASAMYSANSCYEYSNGITVDNTIHGNAAASIRFEAYPSYDSGMRLGAFLILLAWMFNML